MLTVKRLRWTAWNIEHIARHDVVPAEVAEVCLSKPLVSATYKERLRVIGRTEAGRALTVILAPEGNGIYFVITARPASRKERARHREYKGDART